MFGNGIHLTWSGNNFILLVIVVDDFLERFDADNLAWVLAFWKCNSDFRYYVFL